MSEPGLVGHATEVAAAGGWRAVALSGLALLASPFLVYEASGLARYEFKPPPPGTFYCGTGLLEGVRGAWRATTPSTAVVTVAIAVTVPLVVRLLAGPVAWRRALVAGPAVAVPCALVARALLVLGFQTYFKPPAAFLTLAVVAVAAAAVLAVRPALLGLPATLLLGTSQRALAGLGRRRLALALAPIGVLGALLGPSLAGSPAEALGCPRGAGAGVALALGATGASWLAAVVQVALAKTARQNEPSTPS